MDRKPWSPHGLALLDFLKGKSLAEVVVHDEGGEMEVVPARVFFRGPEEFSALEEAALELCLGRVLDVGAGAGCHSVILQQRHVPVCAIDVAPEAVEVMRKRGVRDVLCADVFSLRAGPFDTLLMLMNGIGIVGNLAGLRRFLAKAGRLVRPDGQILLDSYDPGPDAVEGAAREDGTLGARRYPGEMRFQLEYEGKRGPTLEWLFVDFETLADRAAHEGWSAEMIWREEEGHYLARLTRAGGKERSAVRRNGSAVGLSHESRGWSERCETSTAGEDESA
ncbi:MAG TPA: class I SAM-dependent methyltransferase [Candidatus Methylomirabilis sp.]|nr:class I SAM-dependent methyltransferase [Candidatus Methylomirabilis sp.]